MHPFSRRLYHPASGKGAIPPSQARRHGMACFTSLGALLLLPVLGFGATGNDVGSRSIIGGEPASVDAYPFVVYLEFPPSAFCTGTIISPNWVLTAAHCVVDGQGRIKPPSFVEHGYQSSYGFTRRTVRRAVPHPEYYYKGEGFRNDIALVQVSEPFPVAYAAPVGIPSRSEELVDAPSGELGRALGYGRMEGGQWSDGMRSVNAILFHPEYCRGQLNFQFELEIANDGTICAGSVGRSISGGDSGGPLIVAYSGERGMQWLQVGVASMRGKDASGTPIISVFTRVSSHTEWIQQTIQQDNAITPQQRSAGHLDRLILQVKEIEDQIRLLQTERNQLLQTIVTLIQE